MRSLILALCIGLSFGVSAAERPLVQKGSEIGFRFTQMNVPVKGRFNKFSGTLLLDTHKPESSSIQMQVAVASFSADPEVDVEAVKPEWFNAKVFPNATFVSKSVKSLGGDRYETAGTFTLKGISRDLVVPFELKEQASGNADMRGQFVIKRGDFKIGEGEWSAFDVVANDVQVDFHLVLGPATSKH
jgi:polyisoprenoid-binding protein YceI